MMPNARKPKLAVWKFASCDGCQLSLLDCEDELLAVAGAVDIAYFPEATRGVLRGPYDVSLVEGSVTTPHDAERLHAVRKQSRTLITIGACATAGGIQALRNFSDVREFTQAVYARPDFIDTLATSTPIKAQCVNVDFELHGCSESTSDQLLRGAGRVPERTQTQHAVAQRLLRLQAARHLVRHGGPRHPLPRAGHPGGLRRHLPGLQRRGCYGCFGPMGDAAEHAIAEYQALLRLRHERKRDLQRVYSTFNVGEPPFREEAARHGS